MFEDTIEKESSSSSEESLQLVSFELSGEEFGVDIMQVSEIIPISKITRIPQAPECVKGLINLRGKIVVVIDLNRRLGFSPRESDSLSKIIIVKVKDTTIGMLVNSVNGILKLPLSSIESTPDMIKSKINSEYLTGVGKAGNRLLILLNLARVLGEEEVDELNQLSSSSSSSSSPSSPSSPSLSSSSSPSSSYSSSSPSSSFKESPEENT
ncbi:chemotaxis protein CheW [Methanosarcina mazei]|jgi:purine-binding chemotaxis protein CheW|uniref:Histidine kinase n=5 Tax=Methanosarcina mazei TaxID=2209 RepID=A0A0F8GGZ9_METMZ|nr:chemotaxis protein CheW [Methanosarcina mazei]AGF96756.1 Positive regulator of CheA protein activity (CheW) [Methanosarcina mazei Tuc01]AKB42253.1 Positive regulator of CheA protein activity (CheW) [Methanosarcina mazei WWM610]AKB66528.1 Positive regulator of CheA protein activity (CheW) [Methanosarcina mazei S-6]AKB73245.1 Positive regulator of CheA protein activity (CheW) [Methanosarcina mazei C16]KKF98864.1 histidine kinase [Methanosarcina mazei]